MNSSDYSGNRANNVKTITMMPDPQTLAYVRTVNGKNGARYVVHASDGTPLQEFDSREAAFITAMQNDLEPYSVH